jgi:hypothetical protein
MASGSFLQERLLCSCSAGLLSGNSSRSAEKCLYSGFTGVN